MAMMRGWTVRPCPDPPRRLEAVHLGHLHVHQHDVVDVAADALEGLEAVVRAVGPVPESLEDQQDQLLVGRVVLDGEDPQRQALGHGRVELRARRGRAARRAAAREQLQHDVVELRGLDRLGDHRQVAAGRGGVVAARQRDQQHRGHRAAVELGEQPRRAVLGELASMTARSTSPPRAGSAGPRRRWRRGRDHAPGPGVRGELGALGLAGLGDQERAAVQGPGRLGSGSAAPGSAAARIVK
jgi:hypothetical protein